MPSALSKRMPDGSASSSQEGPFPSFQSYSSAPEASTREREREKERERKHSAPLHSPASSLLSGRMACPISNSRRQRRGLSPRPEESFFRDGESTRGEGAVFTKNPPPPPPHSPAPQSLPNKKSGAVTCTRFYRKNKGTIVGYFFSPLCLRLWPCCMK